MISIWMLALGLLLVPKLPFLVPIYFPLITALLAFYGVWLGYRPFRWVALFAIGIALNSWQVQQLVQSQLDPQFEASKLTLDFKIVSVPEVKSLATTFLADVLYVDCDAADCPDLNNKRIRLSWYRSKHKITPGQIWRATVKLKRPRGFANPKGFDYQAWLLSQNVVASGYVHSQWQLLDTESSWAAVREKVGANIKTVAAEGTYRRFWPALLVGDRSAITQQDWQTLQSTGTIHLMAISGLHIGLVAMWAYMLSRFLVRCCGALRSSYSVFVMDFVPPFCSCLMAWCYAALAGFSIPTIRALTACVLINICWVIGLRISVLTLLGFGVALVAWSEPFAWINNGFWLSFCAVFILVYLLTGRTNRRSLMTTLMMQALLALGLCVPLLWLGQGVSWVSPLANMVAVPVVSFLVVPGIFLASVCSLVSVSIAQWLMMQVDWVFSGLWTWLELLQSWPATHAFVPRELSWVAMSLAGVAFLLVLAPKGLGLRGLGSLTALAVVFMQNPSKPALRMTVMDVGQGLSIIVQTPQTAWVYDTGPAFSANFNAGSQIIAPYLRQQGINNISLMVSHGDNDHAGGTPALMGLFKPEALFVGEALSMPFSTDSDAVTMQQACVQGQVWWYGQLSMRVLWPPANTQPKGNNASCVVLMQLDQAHGRVNILLTGDIDKNVEEQILPFIREPVDVLIAPHHGSKTSSSTAFISTAQPRNVVFSSGYKNRYHHPSKEVVTRYQHQGAEMFNTATSGAIIFEWSEGNETIRETRLAESKLWY